jgi:hypothetical protein
MKKIIALIIVSLMPVSVFAQASGLRDINDVAQKATSIGNLFTGLLIGLSIIYIVYAVVRYLIIGDGDDRGAAGMNILYGVVGLFVILSIWGLVSLLTGTFRFQDNQRPEFRSIQLPDIQSTGGSSVRSNSTNYPNLPLDNSNPNPYGTYKTSPF